MNRAPRRRSSAPTSTSSIPQMTSRSISLRRYQAANCANLGFKPNLALKLKGGTKRGGHPGLTATYTPRSGDANVKGLVVRLPRSAFLDQAHIRTICTRVQFAAKACPKAAEYGFIKAWTPLSGRTARRTGLPALLKPQAPRPRLRPARPRRRRGCDQDRLGQRRHQGDGRRRARRPAHQSALEDAGPEKGPDRQQQEPLRLYQQGKRRLRRAQRQGIRRQAGAAA